MPFCSNCGKELSDEAKFCPECGNPMISSLSQRIVRFEGEVHKCPNCGEVIPSFTRNCPACGYEIREAKAASSVKEFALKLEAIESQRVYEPRPKGLLRSVNSREHISKTDEQKISLIKSFSIPNVTEDMLEFMILATSNADVKIYDSYKNSNITKSERALSEAWLSKMEQVYKKASYSQGDPQAIKRIQTLYDNFHVKVKKSKRKGVYKYLLVFGWMPVLAACLFLYVSIYGPGEVQKEIARIETIEQEVSESLANDDYKKALLNAEALVFQPKIRTGDADEIERQWDVKREILIDKIIEEAANNGIILERTPEVSKPEPEESKSSFENINENLDEFNRVIQGEKSFADSDESEGEDYQ